LRIRHARLRAFQRTGLSVLSVIGGGLGVYAVLAVAFHALIEPTLGQRSATYTAPAATVGPSEPGAVTYPPSVAATPGPFAAAALSSDATVRTPAAKIPNPEAREAAPRAVDATAKTAAAEVAVEAKRSAKSTVTRARHYRRARDRWNSFGFLFGASFGPRR
jgi:hypothetical protein